MLRALLGKKIGMTTVFNPDGTVSGVTAIRVGPCTVTQVKTVPRDGYEAAQIGFEETLRLSSPLRGHLKETGPFRYLREVDAEDLGAVQVGQRVDVGIFQPGERVDIVGTSKGKGFAGGVKRYHFRGGPKTHGQSDRHRAPGSIGSTTYPGRVLKGQRMAGHLGHHRVTVRNVAVVLSDPVRNLLLVEGGVPGFSSQLVMVRRSRGGGA